MLLRVGSRLALAAAFEFVLDPGGYGYLLRALCTPYAFILHASVAEARTELACVLDTCGVRACACAWVTSELKIVP